MTIVEVPLRADSTSWYRRPRPLPHRNTCYIRRPRGIPRLPGTSCRCSRTPLRKEVDNRKLVVYNNRNFSGFFSRYWKNAEVDFPLVGKVRKVASDYQCSLFKTFSREYMNIKIYSWSQKIDLYFFANFLKIISIRLLIHDQLLIFAKLR